MGMDTHHHEKTQCGAIQGYYKGCYYRINIRFYMNNSDYCISENRLFQKWKQVADGDISRFRTVLIRG